jgi:hypothetical protein
LLLILDVIWQENKTTNSQVILQKEKEEKKKRKVNIMACCALHSDNFIHLYKAEENRCIKPFMIS